MDSDSCPAATPGSPNSYHSTTYVTSANSGSAMDGYEPENDIVEAQTDFEGNPKRRYRIKKGKKRYSCNRGCNSYTPWPYEEPKSKDLKSSCYKSEDTRSVEGRMRRLQMKRLLNNPFNLLKFPDLQTKLDPSAMPREKHLSQLDKPIRDKDNGKKKGSPLTARNRMVLDEGTTSVDSNHLEDDSDCSTDMGSLHWEEFRRSSIAIGIAGNRTLVTKGLVDSFLASGIDDCSSNVHTRADKMEIS